MTSWNSIAKEVANLNRPDGFDVVRRQKIAKVEEITGRNLLLYAADFTTQDPLKSQIVGGVMSITAADKDGFDEVTRSIAQNGKPLDVLLHSPGGSAEATESIVELLRARFSDIRFMVPSMAKSAATMLAMSGNQILMDERSELGPIDPQLIFSRDNQVVVAPAQAIKDQFQKAQDEINGDPSKLPSWVPILREFGPALLAVCDNHLALAEDLVSKWLQKYMFAGDARAEEKAQRAAHYLNDHNHFRSHGRRVGITDLQTLELNILDLRTESRLHEAVRELYTALMLTFGSTGAYKIFENGQEEAFISQLQAVPANQPEQPQAPKPQIQQQRVQRGRDRSQRK